jgi:ABC-type bacteriocin/lantibiotic exporter with double-glycine peptidase domain
MPRQLLELASIFLLGIIVYINIFNEGASFEKLILTLTFYIIAFSRILPSINRITLSYNFIVYSEVVIERVYEEAIVKSFKSNKSEINYGPIEFKESIELKNIHFKYENSKKDILKNINLKIDKNDILGISGGSGTGKTTLVNLLLGLLEPNKGDILIDGKIINNIDSFQSIVGYVPQDCLILDDSLVNNIVFGQNNNIIDINRIEYCIQASGLNNFLESLNDGLETNLGEDGSKISGGQKQRIGLARALYSDPKVIVLDEATNALDKKTELEILKTIKKLREKTTIIIISHDDKTLKICNNRFNLKALV